MAARWFVREFIENPGVPEKRIRASALQWCQKKSEGVVFTDGPGGLHTDPKLDEIRDEPEFQEILKLAGMDVWPKPALGK